MSNTLTNPQERQAGRRGSIAHTSPSPSKQKPSLASILDANFKFRWIILAGLILAAAMELLDTTIINVALSCQSACHRQPETR